MHERNLSTGVEKESRKTPVPHVGRGCTARGGVEGGRKGGPQKHPTSPGTTKRQQREGGGSQGLRTKGLREPAQLPEGRKKKVPSWGSLHRHISTGERDLQKAKNQTCQICVWGKVVEEIGET